MGLFTKFKHIESQVDAVQMSNDNLKIVLEQIKPEIRNLALVELVISKDNEKNYQIVFRYNSDTQSSVLRNTDYLVKMNDGKMVVMSQKDFDIRYLNTTIDTPTRPLEPQTPYAALVALAKKLFPSLGVQSPEDLDRTRLLQMAEGLKSWYDASTDSFDIKFSDCGIIDPAGIADILNVFPAASFVKPTTRFILNFSNGAWELDDPNTIYNQFNRIALEQLLGELSKVDGAYLNRLNRVYFHSVGHAAPSAIPPSVSDVQWNDFVSKLRNITGVRQYEDVKK